MINISVLLENDSLNNTIKKAHGLSIYIQAHSINLLLDTGPNTFFYKNSQKMKIDLAKVDYCVLSHSHNDHCGGMNWFSFINKHAPIIMIDNKNATFFSTKKKDKKEKIGTNFKLRTRKRLIKVNSLYQIDKDIAFLPNEVNYFGTPACNQTLLMKIKQNLEPDTFFHEGILVIKDEEELVIFNSCSHTGVINSIETVKQKFPQYKIRSYIGGFHFPYNTQDSFYPEDFRNLDELSDYILATKKSSLFVKDGIKLYTGHCTGLAAFDYLKKTLNENICLIHGGETLKV